MYYISTKTKVGIVFIFLKIYLDGEITMAQPYMDLPFAASDASYALSFFQQQYNVLESDIIDLRNATVAGCEKKYEKLIQTLR